MRHVLRHGKPERYCCGLRVPAGRSSLHRATYVHTYLHLIDVAPDKVLAVVLTREVCITRTALNAPH